MKKLIIMFVFILLTFATIVFADNQEFVIKIANEIAELDNPTYVINDRIYVPLRDMCTELGIPVEWDSSSKTANLDIYNKKTPVSDRTKYKDEGVIPDEEAAIAIGKIILEKYAGKPMEYETDTLLYRVKARYFEQDNSWVVFQGLERKHLNGGGVMEFVEHAQVKLNKSTGEVMFINTYSTLG